MHTRFRNWPTASQETRKRLDHQSASINGSVVKKKYKPLIGSKIIKEYHEKTYEVMVVEGGFSSEGEVYKGRREAIIDGETWLKVQEIFEKNKNTKHQKKSSPYSLKGLVKCGGCGATMTPTYAYNHGLRYRYYACNSHFRSKNCWFPFRNVPAEELEARVLEEVLQKLKGPEVLLKIHELARENEVDEVQLQSSLNNIGETWKYLYPQEQSKIMKLLINFIELQENGLNIQMNMDGFNTLLLGLGA